MQMEPPPIPLINSKHDDKLDKYFVKLKLHRDPTSATSDLYDFKMAFFNNDETEEFLLFISNFNITLAASGTLGKYVKVKHIHTLVRGEALRQFDLISSYMEGMNPLKVETVILGLATYFFTVNSLSKQKCMMRRGSRNLRGLKVR